MLVTGAAGFIGGHLCRALGASKDKCAPWQLDKVGTSTPCGKRELTVDLRNKSDLRHCLDKVTVASIYHLAAVAEVEVPFEFSERLVETNVTGTINLLHSVDPCHVIFASSSSVYGDTSLAGDSTSWSNINPLGMYATSKVLAELACSQWAVERGGMVTSFRFGNVIGSGCRGLLNYLTEHALADPDGRRPVQLRGDGSLVRDYVPVDHVVKIMMRAAEMGLPAGTSSSFNIGLGSGMSNRRVTDIVTQVLKHHGYSLTADFSNPPVYGEASISVLAVDETLKHFDVKAVTEDEMIACIEQSVEAKLALAKHSG